MATSKRETRSKQPKSSTTGNEKALARDRATAGATSRALAGGRLSLDSSNTFASFARVVQPPINPDANWRVLSLDTRTLDHITPQNLMELLTNISPEMSRAVWDFQRMCNPGYEIVAYQPGSDTPYPQAQKAIDAFLMLLEDQYGAVDVPINRSFLASFLRGAFLNELVLDADGRLPIDLATPDPWSIRWQQRPDPVRKFVWEMGQWQGGKFVVLSDRPTIRYVPIDPLPGSMYGRPMASPAMFTAVFLLVMMHDIRRVVQQQGMPRIDISIDIEKLSAMIPESVVVSGTPQEEWINAAVVQVQDIYRTLEPDDAYVHGNVISVNRPVGTVDSNSLGGIDRIIDQLVRMLIRALKSMPLLFGLTDGVSEANANRQWEIHVAGIKAMQHSLETVLRRLIKLGLQAQGIVADVKVEFAELRGSELIRDAQAQEILIRNAFSLYAFGLIDQDELAMRLIQRKAASKAPLLIPSNWSTGESEPVNPDPGANRWRILTPQERARLMARFATGMREPVKADGSTDDLPALPSESTPEPFSETERERLQTIWDGEFPEYATLLDAQVLSDEERVRANGAVH